MDFMVRMGTTPGTMPFSPTMGMGSLVNYGMGMNGASLGILGMSVGTTSMGSMGMTGMGVGARSMARSPYQ